MSADDEEEQRRQMFITTFRGTAAQHAASNLTLRVSDQLVLDALRQGETDPAAKAALAVVSTAGSNDRLMAGPQRLVPTLSTLLATQVLGDTPSKTPFHTLSTHPRMPLSQPTLFNLVFSTHPINPPHLLTPLTFSPPHPSHPAIIQVLGLQMEIDTWQHDLAQAREEIQRLLDNAEALRLDHEKATSEASTLAESQRAQQQGEIDRLMSALQVSQRAEENAQTLLTGLREEIRAMEAAERLATIAKNEEISLWRDRHDMLKEDGREVDRLQSTRETLASTQQNLAATKQLVEDQQATIVEMQATIDRLQSLLAEVELALSAERLALEASRTENTGLRDELTALEQKSAASFQAIDDAVARTQEVANELEAAKVAWAAEREDMLRR